MLNKVKEIAERYAQIDALLCRPETAADVAECTRLLREQKLLAPVAAKYTEYRTNLSVAEGADALLTEAGDDAELRAMILQEAAEAKAACEKNLEELKILLLPKDENDDKNVIVEIRAGAGGEESALFAGVLFRMYSMYAELKGFRTELMYANETGLGGFKELSFTVSGENAYSRFKFESGVHRVQRIPVTEANGKIQTSTVTVAVLPEAEEVDVQINPADLQIDTFRSSGAGGQHINKTESAIRITHLPTGLVVECQDERSQYKNKDKAMRVLRARLKQRETEKQRSEISDQRRRQVGTGDRSEKIRTYNYPQSRVTDHRIGLTLYKLDAVLNGALDELIDALTADETAQKLRSLNEETT